MQISRTQRLSAIAAMFFIFAMISFVTNMAAPLGNIWRMQYPWSAMLGNMMNFAAYLFMGIPAGRLLSRRGYRHTALAALAVGLVGLLLQYLSSFLGADVRLMHVGKEWVMLNYGIYLVGAFVCGLSVCMLNTVVNPMLNHLGGGGNRGNQLVQTGGTLNSLSGTLTPLLVGAMIGEVSSQTAIADVSLLLLIAIGVFLAAFLVLLLVRIPEPSAAGPSYAAGSLFAPLRHRQFLLGIVAIFFYVGIEVGIPAELNFYLTEDPLCGAAVGGAMAAVYWLLMMVGRAASSALSSRVSVRRQLSVAALVALLLVLAAILLPLDARISLPGYSVSAGWSLFEVPTRTLPLVLCGLCTSLMWGCIFNLSVEGLGNQTEQASGLFMTMVVGGGLMPLLQNRLAVPWGHIGSYWLVAAMLAYILFFASLGSKRKQK